MLELKNIEAKLGEFKLNPTSLKVNRGEYFVILGESGVGKTVLLEAIAGLVNSNGGEVILNEEDISNKRIQDRGTGLVYQGNVLFPHKTVYENIRYPMKNKINKTQQKERVKELAEIVQAEKLLDRYPETLSGGEYQRVALARTLASEPEILLLDEPISALDSLARNDLRVLLRKINRTGLTIIHVTHDYEEALSLASRIAVMENGKIVQIDKPEDIFNHPKSEFVASFVGIKNFIPGKLTGQEHIELKTFELEKIKISVLTESEPGICFMQIGSNDITLSKNVQETSAQNHFKGVVTDIAAAKLGIEVTVNIGIELVVNVTKESLKKMAVKIGSEIWINFKASAVKIFNKN